MQFSDGQAASRLELDGGRVLTKCDQCQALHADRRPPTVPPCETCRVELLPANEDAARIFYLCRRQVVTAEQGCVVDVSLPAIRAAMEVTGVQDQAGCLTKVLRLWREVELER